MTIVADKVFVHPYSTALLPESVRKKQKDGRSSDLFRCEDAFPFFFRSRCIGSLSEKQWLAYPPT